MLRKVMLLSPCVGQCQCILIGHTYTLICTDLNWNRTDKAVTVLLSVIRTNRTIFKSGLNKTVDHSRSKSCSIVQRIPKLEVIFLL